MAREGNRIEVSNHMQYIVWSSDVALIMQQRNELLSRGTHHELPTDFFKISLGCEGESRGSSFGHRRRQTGINFLGGVRPIGTGRIPTEGGFSCLMLVVGERFRFSHSAG